MKCLDIGTLQAYIDGELSIEDKKKIEKHLSECLKCGASYKEMKDTDDFVFTKVKDYKEFCEESFNSQIKPFVLKESKNNFTGDRKGVSYYMLKYKRIIAVACAVVAVTTCATIQPVRAAISNALSVLRVENVKGINITLKDIQDIQNQLQRNKSEINAEKFGKIKVNGGKTRHISFEDIKGIKDIPVIFPANIPSENKPEVSYCDSTKVDFTLNVSNINQALKSFGGDKMLPPEVEGKTFSANFASTLTMRYNVGGKVYNVIETKQPELQVPDGVNVDSIYEALIELPIIPENMKNQLKSIKDWKNTLYVPVINNMSEEIDINGSNGFVYYSDDNAKSEGAFVIWCKNGVVYGVQGDSKDEVIALAKSMR